VLCTRIVHCHITIASDRSWILFRPFPKKTDRTTAAADSDDSRVAGRSYVNSVFGQLFPIIPETERGGRSGPAGIFPLGLGGQPISLVLLLTELLTELDRVFLGDVRRRVVRTFLGKTLLTEFGANAMSRPRDMTSGNNSFRFSEGSVRVRQPPFVIRETINMTTRAFIRNRADYKYQLAEDYQMTIPIRPAVDIVTQFIDLNTAGRLTVKSGYAWDGPSEPVIDTDENLRASLVHDALYQLMRNLLLSSRTQRKTADELFRDICKKDGVSRFRANVYFHALRRFGRPATNPQNKRVVMRAP
jgi:hypothetical protein